MAALSDGTRRLAPRARTAGWLRMAPRRSSRWAWWCQRLAVFTVPYLAIVVLGHRFGLIETIATYWLLGLGAVVLLASIACGLVGFRDLWVHGHRGGMRSLRGMVLASLLLLPFAYAGVLAFALPALNDVTTDVADPPDFSAAEDDRTDAMNPLTPLDADARAAQRKAYPQLAARSYSGDIDRVFEAVVALVTEREWTVLAEAQEVVDDPVDVEGSAASARPARDAEGRLLRVPIPRERPDPDAPLDLGPISGERLDVARDGDLSGANEASERGLDAGDERYLETLATSAIFGFETDVVIRLVEEDERTVVDMRAASRYGRHDLGANAALIGEFLADLDASLQGLAGE